MFLSPYFWFFPSLYKKCSLHPTFECFFHPTLVCSFHSTENVPFTLLLNVPSYYFKFTLHDKISLILKPISISTWNNGQTPPSSLPLPILPLQSPQYSPEPKLYEPAQPIPGAAHGVQLIPLNTTILDLDVIQRIQVKYPLYNYSIVIF